MNFYASLHIKISFFFYLFYVFFFVDSEFDIRFMRSLLV